MDETSVKLFPDSIQGLITESTRFERRWSFSVTRSVSRSCLRGAFTYAALICDDPVVQPHMPQIIFLKDTHISKHDFDVASTEMPPNIILHRVKNNWTTTDKMKLIFKAVVDAVMKVDDRRQIIFLLTLSKHTLQLRCGSLQPLTASCMR